MDPHIHCAERPYPGGLSGSSLVVDLQIKMTGEMTGEMFGCGVGGADAGIW